MHKMTRAGVTLAALLAGAAIGAAILDVASAAPTNQARATSPGRLNAAPHQVDQARSADDLGFPALCRFDATPVVAGDGKANDLRCSANGELLVAPAAGALTDVNLTQVGGAAVTAGAGAVAAGTQRVTLASNDPAVTDLAALEVLATTGNAQTLAAQTALEILDNVVAGNEAQVDVLTEPATAADAAVGLPAVVKVVGGWDGANVQALATDASGEAQVDVLSSALPAGAATEATLATLATQATLASVLADTATIDAQTLAAQTALEIIDDWGAAADPVAARLSTGAAFYDTVLATQLPAALVGGRLDVVVGAALPAGAADIGDVDVEFAGTAASVDAGTVDPGTQRVVETSPSGRTYVAIDPDQVEAAADIAANAARLSVTCQNVGTTATMLRVGAATAGAVGVILGGGTVANNGTGGVFSTRDQGAVYLWDLSGAGTGDVQCVEEAS